MSIISASKISKSYGTDMVLKDISFNINAGDRVGVVGANGAGKSTLFRIIAREIEADEGSVYFESGVSLGHLRQRDHFPWGGTVMDEMIGSAGEDEKAAFLKKHGYDYDKGAAGMLRSLAFTDDYFQKPVDALSGGERTRLAMAALLLGEPDILLLDEPTNHLDIGTLKWLETYLKNYKGTLVIISHDRYFLDRVVNRIFEIENCKMRCYEGNYSTYKEKKQLRYEQDLKHYLHFRAEVARQEEIIRRFKGHNTEKLVKRAQSREKRLAQMTAPDEPVLFRENLSIKFCEKLASGSDVVYGEDISMSFGSGGHRKQLFSGVNFDIKKGDRICLVGPNGIGKTTLLKIILGELDPDSGYLRLGQNVIPGYYDQEQKLLDDEKEVLDELHSAYIKYGQAELRKLLGRLGFYKDDVFKKVKDLAGGEKAKLSLLKLMMAGANLLILDEPTNHLDIAAKEVFEEALMDFPGTLLIVSHDRYLLQKVPTAIYELSAEGVTVYPGTYDYYEQKTSSLSSGKAYLNRLGRGGSPEDEAALSEKEEKQLRRRREKEEAAAQKRREKALQAAEEAVTACEREVRELEEALCRPEIFSDPKKSREMDMALQKAKASLEENYESWMRLLE